MTHKRYRRESATLMRRRPRRVVEPWCFLLAEKEKVVGFEKGGRSRTEPKRTLARPQTLWFERKRKKKVLLLVHRHQMLQENSI